MAMALPWAGQRSHQAQWLLWFFATALEAEGPPAAEAESPDDARRGSPDPGQSEHPAGGAYAVLVAIAARRGAPRAALANIISALTNAVCWQ